MHYKNDKTFFSYWVNNGHSICCRSLKDWSDMCSAVVALDSIYNGWCAGLSLSMPVEDVHCDLPKTLFENPRMTCWQQPVTVNSVQECGCSERNKAIDRRAEMQWDESTVEGNGCCWRTAQKESSDLSQFTECSKIHPVHNIRYLHPCL